MITKQKLLNVAILCALAVHIGEVKGQVKSSGEDEASVAGLHATDRLGADEVVFPIIILSEKVGDVGREAIGTGIPVVKAPSGVYTPGVFYADIDTISKDRYAEVVALIRERLNQGGLVALETSEFDFAKLQAFLSTNFPAVDISDFNDVAVILRSNGSVILAERVDPSELAMYAGVPHEKTPSGYYRELSTVELPTNLSSTGAVPTRIQFLHRFAAKAYESAPTDTWFVLRHNGTYVDIWEDKFDSGRCVVAWRGTIITHYWDIHADLSSQFSYSNTSIDNQAGVTMKGGKGFVNRVHAYDDTVYSALNSNKCNSMVDVTGHSLGGAAASINALQLAHHRTWRGKLRYVVAWNAPNTVDDATRKAPADTLKSYAEVHVFCRHHDWLVNPLPSHLHRIGNANSSPNKGCTYNKTGTTWSPSPTTNHQLSLWIAEFE